MALLLMAAADGSGRLDRVRPPPMSRRASPGGLPLPGHLVVRHAEAEMLHDQDEALDLLAQTACPNEGLRHQQRRAVGLTRQRLSNMLRLARRLRRGQAPLRHERFRKTAIGSGTSRHGRRKALRAPTLEKLLPRLLIRQQARSAQLAHDPQPGDPAWSRRRTLQAERRRHCRDLVQRRGDHAHQGETG
ncbi:MAG: hypothetical protein AB7I59_01730 [Geminicoccaceae bacterium]